MSKDLVRSGVARLFPLIRSGQNAHDWQAPDPTGLAGHVKLIIPNQIDRGIAKNHAVAIHH
jgi:hypothetical protein